MSALHTFITRIFILAATFLLVSSAMGQFHDGLQVQFGKNRVQYRDFVWQYHNQGEFEIYYYQGGKDLAGDIAGIILDAKKKLYPVFGTNLEGPIQILVFNNHVEFKQSNVGVFAAEDEGNNIGGTAKIVGSKLFVYGRGDRLELERDLVEGLARIAMHQSLYMGNWQDALRNSSILQIPDWFIEGLVKYISDPKSAKSKAYMYDAAISGELARLERSYGKAAGELGCGVWAYISDVYGKQAISNILYMVRVSSSVEGGVRFATGLNLDELLSEVISYTKRQAPREYAERMKSLINVKKGSEFHCSSKSPNGKITAYINNERGQLQVFTVEEATGKKVNRAKHGKKLSQLGTGANLDIAWHPQSEKFSYIIAEKGQPVLVTVHLNEKSTSEKNLYRIDEVLSLDYSKDGRTIVFSGMTNGRSDLYLYRVIGNIQEPLWNDRFDDLDPRFTDDGNAIIFSSNRPDDTLRNDGAYIPFASNLDLFLLDISGKDLVLERLVHTPLIDERNPVPLSNDDFIYLSEKRNGSQDIMWGWKDSTILSIDTIVRYRYYTDTRILETTTVPALSLSCDTTNGVVSITTVLNQGLCNFKALDMPELAGIYSSTSHGGTGLESTEFTPPDWTRELDPTQADIHNYRFERENIQVREEIVLDVQTVVEAKVRGEIKLRPHNYRLNYSLEKIQSQVSNAFGSQFYTPYDGSLILQPGLGNASEIRISDLFEDRHIIAGFNIPANLSNSIMGLAFFNMEGKVDKMWSVQRQGTVSFDNENYVLVETASHFAKYRLTLPFDEVRSIRASVGLRLDRHVPQGTEMFTLTLPTTWSEQAGFEIAWVYDDTRVVTLNILEGTRAKVWSEYYFDLQGETFGTFGFDARRYIRLFSNSILAFRAAGDWSIGQNKLLHLLGGTDNGLLGFSNYNTPIDPDQPYTYQARITPMRGFSSNVRNGSNAFVANAEIRIPIWSSIFHTAAKNDFLRHFQVVGFADVGSAWTGLHPYSSDNSFNSTVYENNPITVTVDNNHEPVIYNWGMGLRSRMLGYWVSANLAWGVDNNMILPRRFSLSLNFDF
jgi:hypothetical protein